MPYRRPTPALVALLATLVVAIVIILSVPGIDPLFWSLFAVMIALLFSATEAVRNRRARQTSGGSAGAGSRQISIFTDQPLTSAADDALGFTTYADAFALLINDRATATPLRVAISGQWGSGKTSLAHLVEERLKVEEYWRLSWDQPPITCWFNAWLHRDADHLGAAFAASVIRDVGRQRSWWWKSLSPLPRAVLPPRGRWRRRVGWSTVVAGLALLGVTAALAIFPDLRPTRGAFGALFGKWREVTIWWAALPAIIAFARRIFRIADTLGVFLDEPKSAAARGALVEVHYEVSRVMRQAQGRFPSRKLGQRRVVIFVDDLERCPGEKALDVCEVATQLLNHDDVVTVFIADLDLITTAATDRYKEEDVTSERLNAMGNSYVKKLVNLQFSLPPLDHHDVADVLARADASRIPLQRVSDDV